MRTLGLVLLAGFILASGTGCMMVGSSIAASTVPLEQRSYTELGPASGSVTSWYLAGFIPLAEGGTQDALQKALDQTKADGLISVSVDNIYIPVPIVGSFYITKVEGNAIKFTD